MKMLAPPGKDGRRCLRDDDDGPGGAVLAVAGAVEEEAVGGTSASRVESSAPCSLAAARMDSLGTPVTAQDKKGDEEGSARGARIGEGVKTRNKAAHSDGCKDPSAWLSNAIIAQTKHLPEVASSCSENRSMTSLCGSSIHSVRGSNERHATR